MSSSHSNPKTHQLAQVMEARLDEPNGIERVFADRRFDISSFVRVLQHGSPKHQQHLLTYLVENTHQGLSQHVLQEYLLQSLNEGKHTRVSGFIKLLNGLQWPDPLPLHSNLNVLIKAIGQSNAKDRDIQAHLQQSKFLFKKPQAFADLGPLFNRCIKGSAGSDNNALFATLLEMQTLSQAQAMGFLVLSMDHNKMKFAGDMMERIHLNTDLTRVFAADWEHLQKSMTLWRSQDLEPVLSMAFLMCKQGKGGVTLNSLYHIYDTLEKHSLFGQGMFERYQKHVSMLNSDDQDIMRQWLANKERETLSHIVQEHVGDVAPKDRRKI